MSKVFDSLRTAQRARSEADFAEPERRENIIPISSASMQYWAPEVPISRKTASDKYYIAAIILLTVALIAMGMYILGPKLRVGRGGDNPTDTSRADIELAIKNKLNNTSSTASSPADPVNLATVPFELVTDSATAQKSGENNSRSLGNDLQTSTNNAPVQAQSTVPEEAPAPDAATAPVPANPPPQPANGLPEKGKFIIREANKKGNEPDPGTGTVANPSPGSKKDLENQFRLAVFQHRNGEILKAYQGYEYVLKYDPYNIDAHNNLGLIFQEIGKHDDALKEFGKVLAIDPRNVQAINNSGVTYFKMQDYTAAVRRFEAALELDPNNAESYANLGLVYTQLDRMADAKAVFLKVLAMNPRHVETHYNLASLYEKNGQLKDAIFYYQKFIAYSTGSYSTLIRDTEKHVAELYQKIEDDPPTKPPKF